MNAKLEKYGFSDTVYTVTGTKEGVIASTSYFEKVVPAVVSVEEALELLKAKGYTVTPPKPKEKGQIAVYRSLFDSGVFYCMTKDKYDDWDSKASYPVVAIVDWEEGQGLPENVNP